MVASKIQPWLRKNAIAVGVSGTLIGGCISGGVSLGIAYNAPAPDVRVNCLANSIDGRAYPESSVDALLRSRAKLASKGSGSRQRDIAASQPLASSPTGASSPNASNLGRLQGEVVCEILNKGSRSASSIELAFPAGVLALYENGQQEASGDSIDAAYQVDSLNPGGQILVVAQYGIAFNPATPEFRPHASYAEGVAHLNFSAGVPESIDWNNGMGAVPDPNLMIPLIVGIGVGWMFSAIKRKRG